MDTNTLERIKKVNNRVAFLQGKRESLNKNLEFLEKTVLALEEDVSDLGKVLKVLGQLVDNMVQKDLDAIDHLVNYGLRVVFPDRNLLFKTRMVEVGGKMKVDFETYDEGVLSESDTHGSVSVVQSLILRVMCIAKTGSARFLMLDETFAALDDDYILRVGYLLKELASKMKMDILLATFNAEASDADTVLRARFNAGKKEMTVKVFEASK